MRLASILLSASCCALVACGPSVGAGGDDDDGPSVDAGPGAGDGGGDVAGCPDVDVLFVIDDSGSMADQQDSLIASFPGFVAGIQSRLRSAQSVHIGVVTTEDYAANPAGCRGIGSLVTQTGGPSSSNRVCGPFASGAAWLDARDPALADRFACVGKVGAGGSSDERVARALMNALDPAANAAGACNAGFSRPDSLLVVVLITDEDDVPDGCGVDGVCDSYGSGGTSADWYQAVVAARGGRADNIVVLALIARQLDNTCGATPAARLLGFTNRFAPNNLVGDVCAASYDGFFLDALPVVSDACERWVP
ncbi:MAG: hypothetical protein R3B06_13320 [Kofleriaceae bacterium]